MEVRTCAPIMTTQPAAPHPPPCLLETLVSAQSSGRVHKPLPPPTPSLRHTRDSLRWPMSGKPIGVCSPTRSLGYACVLPQLCLPELSFQRTCPRLDGRKDNLGDC